jgi:single-strand DNA-binding protein
MLPKGSERREKAMSDTITITGNIAADPERRQAGAGGPVTTFRVASSQRHFDRSKGEWVETGTNWYRVSAFRSLGENAFESLHKGERVIVTGRLKVREWQNDKGKGMSVEIDADGIGHDLRWGTSHYSRAGQRSDEWEADGSQEGASPHAPVQQWATAAPPDDGTTPKEVPGDWGAPGGSAAGTAAEDPAEARDAELADAPF